MSQVQYVPFARPAHKHARVVYKSFYTRKVGRRRKPTADTAAARGAAPMNSSVTRSSMRSSSMSGYERQQLRFVTREEATHLLETSQCPRYQFQCVSEGSEGSVTQTFA